jgi:hypothetical protein
MKPATSDTSLKGDMPTTRASRVSFIQRCEDTLEELGNQFRTQRVGRFLVSLVLLAVVLHIYPLGNFLLSIDDEASAWREDPAVWVAQGRWGMYVVERFVLPQPIIPFLSLLLFLVSISVSYVVLLYSHRIPRDWRSAVLFPLLCTFPVWNLITSFDANTLGTGIALVCTVVAHAVITRAADRYRAPEWTEHGSSILVAAVPLALAIGIYQSFVLAFVTFGLGAALCRCLRDPEGSTSRRILGYGALVCVAAVAALSLHLVILKVAQAFIAEASTSFYAHYDGTDALFEKPLKVIATLGDELYTLYLGSAKRYGESLSFMWLVVPGGILAFCVKVWRRTRASFPLLLAVLASLIALPFAFNLVSGGEMPIRSLVALPYVVWLLAFFLTTARRPLASLLNVTLVLLLSFQVLRTNGTYAAAGTLALEEDRMLAADIYRRIGELITEPTYDGKQVLHIDVFGSRHATNLYSHNSPATLSPIGASFFEWDGGNVYRMLFFMKLLGFSNLAAVEAASMKENTEHFLTMPVWPAAGCVKRVGDVFLVKLSTDPDPRHRDDDASRSKR